MLIITFDYDQSHRNSLTLKAIILIVVIMTYSMLKIGNLSHVI